MKRKPYAACTRCYTVSYNVSSINQPCGERTRNSKGRPVRCSGIYSSRIGIDDWKVCPTCKAADDVNSCIQCSGVGWTSTRLF